MTRREKAEAAFCLLAPAAAYLAIVLLAQAAAMGRW